MADALKANFPSRHTKSWLRRNVYWIMVICSLLSVIVYLARWRRVVVHAPVSTNLPEYASAMVTFDGKPHLLPEILDGMAAQAHVRIDLFDHLALLNRPVEVKAGTCTLRRGMELLRDAARPCFPENGMDYEYAKDGVTVGDTEAVFSRVRCYVVVYPVSDFLVVNDPIVGYRGAGTRMQELADLIKSQVRPDAWRENGGVAGSCTFNEGDLVIDVTPGMHWEIEQLLGALRAAR